ncbi:CoA-binding protein [Croceivirga radicis]|uniref:CoA-binding protein n=1 Tax=Croceivirga radicis TaxID=1929488 RepID=A0A1V6LNU1_9FLAO|nr:CoA-binding protein [Croceivirga radicis]OQD41789.1 CoA-binding protein [Croceivirga radicis]
MQRTLVFGASLNPSRYSNMAIKRLQEKNVPTVAFGLRGGNVGTVQINTNLNELPKIDVVTLYMNPERQKQYYDSIIALGPKKVIFNPGTENPDFYKLLKVNGIEVEIACTLVLLATNSY